MCETFNKKKTRCLVGFSVYFKLTPKMIRSPKFLRFLPVSCNICQFVELSELVFFLEGFWGINTEIGHISHISTRKSKKTQNLALFDFFNAILVKFSTFLRI